MKLYQVDKTINFLYHLYKHLPTRMYTNNYILRGCGKGYIGNKGKASFIPAGKKMGAGTSTRNNREISCESFAGNITFYVMIV